jgi:hypothetical protein
LLGGDRRLLYRATAEEWRRGLALRPHGGGEGVVDVRSGREGVRRRQGHEGGGGGGRSGTRRVKQGKQGGPVPWASVGEELGAWAATVVGSAQ